MGTVRFSEVEINSMSRLNLNFICILCFSFLIIPFQQGCSNKNILDEDKFIKVYSDLIIAEDTTSSLRNIDSVKAFVFKRNGITEKDYKSTIQYYNEDPQRWQKFFTKAIAYVESLKKQKGR